MKKLLLTAFVGAAMFTTSTIKADGLFLGWSQPGLQVRLGLGEAIRPVVRVVSAVSFCAISSHGHRHRVETKSCNYRSRPTHRKVVHYSHGHSRHVCKTSCNSHYTKVNKRHYSHGHWKHQCKSSCSSHYTKVNKRRHKNYRRGHDHDYASYRDRHRHDSRDYASYRDRNSSYGYHKPNYKSHKSHKKVVKHKYNNLLSKVKKEYRKDLAKDIHKNEHIAYNHANDDFMNDKRHYRRK